MDVLPRANFLAVAEWNGDIHIFSADQGTLLTTIHESAYATSLQMEDSKIRSPKLLVGLADGGFAAYPLDDTTIAQGTPKNRQASSLGTRPVRLVPLDISPNLEERVVAAGISDRLSLIFESKDHFEFSSSGKKVRSTYQGLSLTSERGSCSVFEHSISGNVCCAGNASGNRF